MRQAANRVAVLVFISTMLLQAAWAIALPPFEGNDEIDHVYRAAAVAHGEWSASDRPADGWGRLVTAPAHLVEAARPVCETLRYYGPDNCDPVEVVDEDYVTIASGGANRHPLYYWLAYLPAAVTDAEGAAALYVARFTSMTFCSLFLALAAWASALWSRSIWPLAALFLSLTPMVLFSNAVVAPNGVEACAALALWSCLLGLGANIGKDQQKALILWASPPAAVLATVRGEGPFWLALIGLTVMFVLGRTGIIRVLQNNVWPSVIFLSTVVLSSAASSWWIFNERLGSSFAAFVPKDRDEVFRPGLAVEVPLWLFQSVGVFPRRFDFAPMVVYPLEVLTIVALLALGFRAANRRLRAVFLVAAAVGLGVQIFFALTIGLGANWQGKYALPFMLGVILLMGLALDVRRPRDHPLLRAATALGYCAVATAQLVGAMDLLNRELTSNPFSGDPAWLMPWPWLVATLTILGLLGWLAAVRHAGKMTAVDTSGNVPSPVSISTGG